MAESLQDLFKEIGKTNLLSREEEVALSKRIEAGDQRARDRMIRANLRLAISIAKKYANKGCDLEDLIQESSIGLIKAVDRFDWRKGFKFSTYACWWIKQAVRRHIASHGTNIKLPPYARATLFKIKMMREEYEKEFGVYPSEQEIAEMLGTTVATLRAMTTCASTPKSLDAQTYFGSEGGRTIGETIEDESAENILEVIDRGRLMHVIKRTLSSLSPREEQIMRLRFGISEDDQDHDKFPITKKQLAAMESSNVNA